MTVVPTMDLLRVLPEPMALLTGDGDFVAANPPFCRLFAKTGDNLREHNLADLVADPPEKISRYLHACAQSRQMVLSALTIHAPGGAQEVFRCEGAVVRPAAEDEPALLLLRLRPREWASNRFVLLTRKIEELNKEVRERQQAEEALRRAEAQLRSFNQTLERLVIERTAELERSNRELDQFAYIASHDLKAPLRAITHLAHWINDDAGAALPPQAQQHLERLRGRIARMERMLDDLLQYARAGRQTHTLEPVESAALIRDAVELLSPPPGFRIDLQEPLPRLLAERVPLETVFRNLIGNAIKHHHEPESGRVAISGHVNGQWVEFNVADNGPGIAEQFHERIFIVFQSLKPRDRVEGSGMGLSVVKKLVESRGGSIWVESSLDHGATFRFTWPYRPIEP